MTPRMISFDLGFFVSFRKKLILLTFNKGNNVFGFSIGILSQKFETLNVLKTLTMVSMETEVVSEDSFVDKLSEKLPFNGF